MPRLTIGLIATLALNFLVAPLAVEAQRPSDVRRIGYLRPGGSGPQGGFEDILRAGLRDRGYVEGWNLAIESRVGTGRAQLAALAAELVGRHVEVLVTWGVATWAAMSATQIVPIVFSFSGDPIEAGFVQSLGRPGGNMTGITWLAFELVGKRLEFLKEAAPQVARVAALANPAHPGEQRELAATAQTATAIGATLQYHQVRTTADIQAAFEAIVRDHAQALLVLPDGLTIAHRQQLAEFAVKQRLPSVFGWREYVEAGGLMAYGPNRLETAQQLATYVDKILQGATPADLPVEQPMKFELVINLKTAQQLGLTLSPTLLFQATEIIR